MSNYEKCRKALTRQDQSYQDAWATITITRISHLAQQGKDQERRRWVYKIHRSKEPNENRKNQELIRCRVQTSWSERGFGVDGCLECLWQ